MKTFIRSITWFLALLAVLGPGMAAETDFSTPADPYLERASQATGRKDWAAAQGILKEALQANPSNADYHNLYAYALRKAPNPDMDLVFRHYAEALRLDPAHRGAHEYIGEAYLLAGNLAKAKEHLSALGRLCFRPCSEYTDLKNAIAEYEATRR